MTADGFDMERSRLAGKRMALDSARQAHMLALQDAIAAGVPAAELEHDTQAFTSACRQLITICTMPTGRAPMRLGGRALRGFVHTESYLHDAAKNVVARWFRESQDESCFVRIGGVWSRTNREGPCRGVYVEYPIGVKAEGVDIVWDEEYDPPGSGRKNADPSEWRPNDWCPSVEFVKSKGIKVKCVCDVMLIHKGRANVAIEVVHKSPVPKWKRSFLHTCDVQLIEVDALRVLKQIKRPAELPMWRSAYP